MGIFGYHENGSADKIEPGLVIMVCTQIQMMLPQLFIIVIIASKKTFYHPRYILLLSVCISNTLAAVFRILWLCLYKHTAFSLGFRISYTLALLSTVYISVDMYIAVKYSLRYYSIITREKVIVTILLSWLVVGLVYFLLHLEPNKLYMNLYHFRLGYMIFLVNVRIACSVIILLIGMYTGKIRNAHKTSIRKRQRYFGAKEGEQTNNSIRDMIRLNYLTVIFLAPSTVTGLVKLFIEIEYVLYVDWIFVYLLEISNPFIFAYSNSELSVEIRRLLGTHCKHIFCCCDRITQPNQPV